MTEQNRIGVPDVRPRARTTRTRRPSHLVGRPGWNKGQRQTIEILTNEEVLALMAHMNKGATGCRNRAAVAVLYRCGLRVSELLALRPRHVDLEAGTVRVERGKGGKDRTVGIDAGAAVYLQPWIARRRALGINGNAPLICALDGAPLSRQALSAALKGAARRAGITKTVRPHGLRHSHAAALSRGHAPMPAIQRQLGHSSLATTAIYLDHIGADLGEIVGAALPRWDGAP